jgi:cobalamin biosynthesis protein CobT
MAKKKKALTKKQLVDAYNELHDVVGVEPPIDHKKMKVDEFEEELASTVADLVTDDDEFTKKTQTIFDLLLEKYPPEEDEDEDEDEDEEDEDEEDEEDEDEDEDEEDEDEDEDEEDEEEDEDEDEDEDEEDEEEDEEDEDEDEEEDEDEDEDEEEEEDKKPVKKKKAPAKKKKAPAKKKKKTKEEAVLEVVEATTNRKALLGVFKAHNSTQVKNCKLQW